MRPLMPGDTIGLVSPASRADHKIFALVEQLAATRGFRTKVFGEGDQALGRLAADDKRRAENLMAAFADESIIAILCTRGGYGSGRLLDMLELDRAQDKIFVGYSDITALLLHLQAHTAIKPFHGPMASDLATKAQPETLEWFFSMIEGRQLSYDLGQHEYTTLRSGCARGVVWGGNITIIESLIGTDSLRVPDGAILVLEDVNEVMYAFDRSLVHLRRAGIFDRASAIIFADLKLRDGMSRDNSLGLLLEEVLESNFDDFEGPIAFGLPCGHTDRQLMLPMGAQAELKVNAHSFSLCYEDFWKRPIQIGLAA